MNRFPNKPFRFLFLLVCLPTTALPQEPVPTPPFVNFPLDYANYTVEIKSVPPCPAYTPGSRKQLAKVEIVLAAPFEKRVNRWNDHSTTEDWVYRGTVVAQSPYGNWLNTLGKGNSMPLDASDFSSLVTGDYKGNERFKNIVCFRFEKSIHQPTPPGLPEIVRNRIYWVDVRTKLPVAVEDGPVSYVYTFRQAPTEHLELPAKYREEFIKSGEAP